MKTLLLSGGVDSVAVLNRCDVNRCVNVMYGQPSEREEYEAARRWADRYGVPFIAIRVRGMNLGEMLDGIGKPGPRVIQARNAVLVSLAANVTRPGGEVLIGAHRDDAKDYPDCRWNWIEDLSNLMRTAYDVTVSAPLIHETREQIVERLGSEQIEFSMCWSCYTPKDRGVPCGGCNSCRQ